MNCPVSPWRIGIDVGGTFTDLVLVDATHRIHSLKAPTNIADPSVGIVEALRSAGAQWQIELSRLLGHCQHFVHGSTIATNTLLESTGSCVGLLTTAGFRDSLEIRRGIRRNMWDHRAPWDDVLIPRSRRIGIRERIDARGHVRQPLSIEDVDRALVHFRSQSVEAVAICFLHSYQNPAHEELCRARIESAAPELFVTTSSSLSPIVGEYERCSTVVANGYVAQRVVPYLRSLEANLRTLGFAGKFLLVQSNSGIIAMSDVVRSPISLALSGPAAGAGALEFVRSAGGIENLISIETGGTSCDVTLVHQGVVSEADATEIRGTHIGLPVVEIHTVSTGGGSIASVDAGGLLRLGPRGAGSTPGPACYGRGGELPTTTDAQVLLGRLREGPYGNGTISVTRARAEAAISRHLAAPLGISPLEAAIGVLRLADQQIRQAVERVSLERGLDPSHFTLVGAGGAGALHVAAVARALGCRSAYVPRLGGVFCALGMCNLDIRHDRARPVMRRLAPESLDDVWRLAMDLRDELRTTLRAGGFDEQHQRFSMRMDIRYAGQQWPLRIDAPDDPWSIDELVTRFEHVYTARYAQLHDRSSLEVVAVRCSAFGAMPRLEALHGHLPGVKVQSRAHRTVFVDPATGSMQVPIFSDASLRPGDTFDGPAVIEAETTTILVGVGDRLHVNRGGDFVIDVAEAARG